VVNPSWRELDRKCRSIKTQLTQWQARFAALTLHPEADILPNPTQDILPVRVHPMANQAIAHLLDHLHAAEFSYPGINLKLNYAITEAANSGPETGNLVPSQIPGD